MVVEAPWSRDRQRPPVVCFYDTVRLVLGSGRALCQALC